MNKEKGFSESEIRVYKNYLKERPEEIDKVEIKDTNYKGTSFYSSSDITFFMFVEGNKTNHWVEEAYINNNGDLVMGLTKKQRENWMNPVLSDTDDEQMNHWGFSKEYNEDYTELEVSASKDIILSFQDTIEVYAFYAGVEQVLRGQENWHVKVKVIDTDTGVVWQEIELPEEKFDWGLLKDSLGD